MIEPGKLSQSDVGRKVRYTSGSGQVEEGTLSSWNDKNVFVKFKGPTGEACNPTDVFFSFPKLSKEIP